MLDPLTALSVAATIVQFVDLGSRFLVEGYGTYKSMHGQSHDALEIQALTVDLDELTSRLIDATTASPGTHTREEVALAGLAKKAQQLAQTLLNLLIDLQVHGKGPWRSWQAFRQTVRQFRKKEQIEQLCRYLEAVKLQLNTHLLNIIRNNQSTVVRSMQDMVMQSNAIQMQAKVDLATLRDEILVNMERIEAEYKSLSRFTGKADDYVKVVRLYETNTVFLYENLIGMHSQFNDLAAATAILNTLRYPEMPLRYQDIHSAYENTFGWIFKRNTTHFKTWLETGSGIFWVSGKAGSGKSTLMKFLDKHDQTKEILTTWATQEDPKRRLVTGNFYFWNSGHAMQRSQEGLIRSLLFQIARQVPEIIPDVFPERWLPGVTDKIRRDFSDPWSREELSKALNVVLTRQWPRMPVRFCFFIDGLDEFEGDLTALVSELDHVAMSASVKLCVSSRPWTEFKDAYGANESQLLVMQDLTKTDMEKFVQGELGRSERFLRLAHSDPHAQDLITAIRDRAEGVFLWVVLVVRSLLRGLGKHDDVHVLEQRLDALPSDLKKFFELMMHSIEDVYRSSAARLIRLHLHLSPLPLTAVWVLPQERHDFDPAVAAPIKTLNGAEHDELRARSISSLNAWGRDFFELAPRPQHSFPHAFVEDRIGFLHRTVRDFMLTPEMQSWLDANTKIIISPWLSLVRIHVLHAKLLGPSLHAFIQNANVVMRCAREYEYSEGKPAVELLDEFNTAGNHLNTLVLGSKAEHWTYIVMKTKGCGFLAFAVKNHLDLYVKTSLEAHGQVRPPYTGPPLLDFLLPEFTLSSPASISIPGDVLVSLQVLLEHGMDPNAKNLIIDREASPWERVLERCDVKTGKFWWPIALKYLEFGASLTVIIHEDGQREERTVFDCLAGICPWPDAQLHSYLEETAARRQGVKTGNWFGSIATWKWSSSAH